MGYELHITRKAVWHDEIGSSITLEEWDKLAAGDPDLLSTNFDGPFYSDSSGNIVAKNPEKSVRAKMHRMAKRLGAKVQGDDGELYDAAGDMIAEFSERGEGRIYGWPLVFFILLLLAAVIVLSHVH